jgi:hypothetical protein
MLNSPFVREQSLVLAHNLLNDARCTDAGRIWDAYVRVVGHGPTPQETAKVKVFLNHYADGWSSEGSPIPSKHSDVKRVDRALPSLAFGIVREDGLMQDDTVDSGSHDPEPSADLQPHNARLAAWAAFVQALYGSAAFQFVR